jgi:hypothetical protein
VPAPDKKRIRRRGLGLFSWLGIYYKERDFLIRKQI